MASRSPDSAGSVRRPSPPAVDSFVLARLSWIVLALGVAAAGLFAIDPDPRAHPGLLLLGITGLVGTGTLRLLAFLLRTPPREHEPDDA